MSSPPKTVRNIDVRKQHVMSFRETWHLCIQGVKHRLFRSALTLAVVVLAVAFFMFLLSESMFERAVARGVTGEDAAARASQVLLTEMLSPASDAISVERLAEASGTLVDYGDGTGAHDASAWYVAPTGFAEERVAALARLAKRERVYAKWLDDLPVGKRIVLVGKRTGRAAFRHMIENREELHRQLGIMVDVRVPGRLEGLDAFLDAFPAYEKEMAAFTAAWNAAVAKAVAATAAATGARPVDRWVPDAPEADAEAWRASLAAIGFAFPPENLRLMRTQLREANEYADVLDALNRPALRKEWSTKFRETKATSAEEKMPQLADPRAAQLLPQFPAELLPRIAARHAVAARLALLQDRLAPVLRAKTAAFGLTGRQIFLLCISFLVCMVGIANAMLMAITERFREIATMKCLGATDGYILSQFMLEAALQGFFGGLLGAVVGFVIAVARSGLAYGAHLWRYFPAGEVALCFVFSLAAGVLLSALASMQPSWSASRMAPMEAMRVE